MFELKTYNLYLYKKSCEKEVKPFYNPYLMKKEKLCDQECKYEKEKEVTKCCYYRNQECLLKGDNNE